MRAAFALRDKQERTNAINAASAAIKATLSAEDLADINLGSAIKKLEIVDPARRHHLGRRPHRWP